MIAVEIIQDISVVIHPREVLWLQGYRREGERPKKVVQDMVEEEIEEGRRLLQPQAICTEVKAEIGEDKIRLENGLALQAGGMSVVWRKADRLAAVVCTIGPALEKRVAELIAQGEEAAALVLDSFGSAAVEKAAEQVDSHLCQSAAARGMKIGPRLSPGHGTWPLADQKTIFALLPAHRIGVSINEQGMMVPIKSISFCVGMGERLESSPKTSPCRYCNMKDCRFRRA